MLRGGYGTEERSYKRQLADLVLPKDSVLQQGYPKLEQTHFVPIFVSGRVVVFFLLFFSFLFSSPGAMAVLIRRILFLRFVDGSDNMARTHRVFLPPSTAPSVSSFSFSSLDKAVLTRRILFLRFVDGSLGQPGSCASGFPFSTHRSFSSLSSSS